jgi:hypothetical protein
VQKPSPVGKDGIDVAGVQPIGMRRAAGRRPTFGMPKIYGHVYCSRTVTYLAAGVCLRFSTFCEP